ncbi:hypothetical protein [Natranaerobius trueperi]|uniref:Flagellar FliJ protein n=1 Tax=Natranaerobius trueperi TaxID=759412 RepID=A0A226C0U1_9FIRM|nr:hypothetical protein [Natranaerobius trueperi]OWZ84846.1 hypothetical protein CDO51_00105 [Natranaerobius trueperi]
MEKLNEWIQYLKEHRKQTKKFLNLTERQEKLVAKDKVDEFMSLFEKKQEIMKEVDRLKEIIIGYKEEYQDYVEEPYLKEIRTLQKESQENIETAIEKNKALESKLNNKKSNIGEELKKTKMDKQTVDAYLSGKNRSKGEGFFFDKKN